MNDMVLEIYKYLSFKQEMTSIIFTIVISIIIILITLFLVRRELKNG